MKATNPSQTNEVTATSFSSLTPPLSPGILTYIQSQNFTTMTPVQSAVIPLFLSHKDVCVQAVTGSGKTLAFLIPMIEILLNKPKLKKGEVGGVVISPTRELAAQIYSVCRDMCQHVSLPPPLLLVGASRTVVDDISEFAALGSDILVGTPGRLEDLLTRYDNFSVKTSLEVLVLDEADLLLDMGFETTLCNILSKLPKMRRTGLFSATQQSTAVRSLVRVGLRNPVTVSVDVKSSSTEESSATPSSLENYYMLCPLYEKSSRLIHFLKQHKDEKVIIFFLTCATVQFYSKVFPSLLPKQYSMESLHGKMNQKRREKTMERFRSFGKGSCLLCTDVAARGIDIADVQWVVQYDAPQDPSSYIHRVGRSARAGKTGKSLICLTPREEPYVDFLKLKNVVRLNPLPDEEECCPPPAQEEEKRKKINAEEVTITNIHGKTIPNILPQIKSLVKSDRDVLESSTKAYTSHIRAYKEHHCAFIFRFPSLDLGLLAQSYCLLKLPKMPELNDVHTKLNFTPEGMDFDISKIAFADKHREAARLKRLASDKITNKQKHLLEKQKKQQEKEAFIQKKKQEAIAKGRNPNKKRGKQAQMFDEWDDLAKEERLYKKLKRKKISEEEYKRLMYGDDKKEGDVEKED